MPFVEKKLEYQLGERQLTVWLDDIHELFVAQPLDIYSEEEWDYMGQSALDRIIQHMTPGTIRRKPPLRLVIRLPPEKMVPDIARKTETAVRRWAQRKTRDNHLSISINRWNALRALPLGLLFLASCIVIDSFILGRLDRLAGTVLTFFLAEAIIIVGAISLETPVGAFLYEHLPFRRENEVLEILMKMEIEVLPQAPGSPRVNRLGIEE